MHIATRPQPSEPLHRREFLRRGLAISSGITASLPPLVASGVEKTEVVRKGKSVVFLFLQGGPPHIEFFDPKMSAAAEFRSVTGEVRTTLPGITFGGTFPKLAERAHRLAIVRSYGTQNTLHTYLS